MKVINKYKNFFIVFFIVPALLCTSSKGIAQYQPVYQSYTSAYQPQYPSYASHYQPVYPPYTSQYQPMYSGNYPSSVLPGSYPVASTYPQSFTGTGEYSYQSSCPDIALDKDYVYSLIRFKPNPLKGQSYSTDLAIFQSSGPDDYNYISSISLFEGGPPTTGYLPHTIFVQDNFAVIGTMGSDDKIVRVYIVDISDKENPKMLNSLDLPHHFPNEGTYMFNLSGMAIKNNVMYLSISYRYDGKTALYSIDITNPDGIDENKNVLDILTIDYQIYDMVSASNYLYCAGTEADTEEQRALIVNISNPSNLSLTGTCDLGGIQEGKTNLVVNGATLLAVVQESGETGLDVFRSNEESSSVLKIIDVANPAQPRILSSSGEVKGRPGTPCWGHELICLKDNYTYILSRDGKGSTIHVFNISNLENPQLVKTERVTQDVYTAPRYDEDGGMGLYLVDERLYYHTGEKINVFDISNPLDLPMVSSMDLFIRMAAGGYNLPILSEYDNPYVISPPSLYGYGAYDPYPSLYGFGGYGGYDPYPSLYGFDRYNPYPAYGYGSYGGYGIPLSMMTASTLTPGPVVHIDEINIEGGLYIGELHLGSGLSLSPYPSASFISPSRGSSFLGLSIPPPSIEYDAFSVP